MAALAGVVLMGVTLETSNMNTSNLLSHVTTLLDQAGVAEGAFHHGPSRTHLLRHHATTDLNATVYQPLLCLILQGAKQVGSSTRTLTVGAGQSLVVSHTLPVVSRITEASREVPYTALVFPLDLDLLRSLAPAVSPALNAQTTDPFSICLNDTDPGLEAGRRAGMTAIDIRTVYRPPRLRQGLVQGRSALVRQAGSPLRPRAFLRRLAPFLLRSRHHWRPDHPRPERL